jgi:hypothetical protein
MESFNTNWMDSSSIRVMHSKTYFSFRSGLVYKKLSNQHMVVIVGLLHEYTLMVINSANKLDLNLAQSNLQAKGAAVPLASLLGIIFLVLGCSFVFIS